MRSLHTLARCSCCGQPTVTTDQDGRCWQCVFPEPPGFIAWLLTQRHPEQQAP